MPSSAVTRLSSLALILVTGSSTLAQPIVVTVKPTGGAEASFGPAFASGANFSIDLGAVAAAYPGGFDYIRVDDTTNGAAVDIGAITLSRTGSAPVPTEVRLLVADPSGSSISFPDSFTGFIEVSSRDWGGLSVDQSVPTSTRIILAGAVARDITGPVTCGQVFTLQALAGNIGGDVSANWPDGRGNDDGDDPDPSNGVFLDSAIQDIRAKSTTGRIIAGQSALPDPQDSPPNCSIRSVRVGVGFDATSNGIRGDILAYGGHIRHIESTGHVGLSTAPVNIHAGYGLRELFCTATVSGQIAVRDLHCDMRVNIRPPLSGLDFDGFLRQVRVSGDVTGAINATVMRPRPGSGLGGFGQSDPGGSTYGLFVGGNVDADITFGQGALVTSLVAESFTSPIIMDTYLRGRVVARSGMIASISVGADPHPTGTCLAHGFLGSERPPDWDTTDYYPGPDDPPRDEPMPVIRAPHILHADISRMLIVCEKFPPMIESPQIDELRIGSMHDGSMVWSGERTCIPPATWCGPEPAEQGTYASISDAQIGSVFGAYTTFEPRYRTALFVLGFDRFDVTDTMTGEFHLDDLEPQEHLRIGCALGAQVSTTPGVVTIRQAGELRGQVSINSLAHAPDTICQGWAAGWNGIVQLPTINPTIQMWSLFPPSSLDVAPHYDRLSGDLGGGAVGEFPASLHHRDCDPPHPNPDPVNPPDTTPVPRMSAAEFCHRTASVIECTHSSIQPKNVRLTFRDYVSGETAALPVEVRSLTNPTADYSMLVVATFEEEYPGGPSRTLVIHGDPAYELEFVPDTYVVTPRLDSPDRLLCDRLLTSVPMPVADFAYTFELYRDCNHNGVDDVVDRQNGWPDANDDGILDCCQGVPFCNPDYNDDGNTDQDDVAYLLNVIGGGSNPSGRDPDFNRDGNVDQDDYYALIATIAGGPCP
jgi:hypothetical protein